MKFTKKQHYLSFVFEYRHELVRILGCLALLAMWADFHFFDLTRNNHLTTLACAVSGTLLVLVGVIIRLWAGLYIGGNKNSRLIRKGPYSLIRNPLYAGNLISASGVSILTQSLLAATVIMAGLSVIYLATIRHEENKLLKIFGSEYNHYLENTPMLFPCRWTFGNLFQETGNGDVISYRNLVRELKRGGMFIMTGLFTLFTAMLMY